MEKLGIAIVGCGAISKNHAEAVAKSSNAELLYCMDIVKERAEELSEQFGGIPSDDFNEILSDPVLMSFIYVPLIILTMNLQLRQWNTASMYSAKNPWPYIRRRKKND